MINANAGNKPVRPPSTHQPSFRSPAEARKWSVPSGISNGPGPAPSSIIPDEIKLLASSDRSRLTPVFDHETPAADEFSDSPFVGSTTPPNSSTPPTTGLSESSMGWSSLVEVILAVINIGRRHPSVEQFSTTGSSLADSPAPKTDQRRHQGGITW